eukprot:TRINITY_DN16276_c1_g3_i1.p3 TRINITY_DN16276_c1_g3~~TRINITY_DN16276_c1_g3_i1.p3  ORF type:complete len:154 (+),score=16.59 TRINITY_DN16276_c1_g3_i1:139-600(+)
MVCQLQRFTQFGTACQGLHRRPRNVLARNGLGDDLLDYIQAGPKLRKWYGETDKMLLPKDGKPSPTGDDDDYEGPRDAVLVTDANSPMGELIVLQLVLARVKIKVLVKDVAKAKQEFGPYVDPVAGDVNSGAALKKAGGARAHGGGAAAAQRE